MTEKPDLANLNFDVKPLPSTCVQKTCQLCVTGSNTAVVGSRSVTFGSAANVSLAENVGVTYEKFNPCGGGVQLNPMQPLTKRASGCNAALISVAGPSLRKQHPWLGHDSALVCGVKHHAEQLERLQHSVSHASADVTSSVGPLSGPMDRIEMCGVLRESHTVERRSGRVAVTSTAHPLSKRNILAGRIGITQCLKLTSDGAARHRPSVPSAQLRLRLLLDSFQRQATNSLAKFYLQKPKSFDRFADNIDNTPTFR